MFLLAVALYVAIACALIVAPVSIWQGARYGKGQISGRKGFRNSSLVAFVLPLILTAVFSVLFLTEMATDTSEFWRVPGLWLITFGFAMVPIVPLSLFSFWIGKVLGGLRQ